jgi:hypothetical protein
MVGKVQENRGSASFLRTVGAADVHPGRIN